MKAQSGISPLDTSHDATIQTMLAGVSGYIIQDLHRDISQTTYTEYYNGDGGHMLMLRQYPIISVTNVWEDGAGYFGQGNGNNGTPFDSTTLLVEGTDWVIASGQHGVGSNGFLRRLNGVWYGMPSRHGGLVSNQTPLQNGNIKVTYVAGYLPTSPQMMTIQMAVNDLISRKLSNIGSGGIVQSQSFQGASESYFSPEELTKMMGSIESALASVRMMVI